jgi:hypothetical protein
MSDAEIVKPAGGQVIPLGGGGGPKRRQKAGPTHPDLRAALVKWRDIGHPTRDPSDPSQTLRLTWDMLTLVLDPRGKAEVIDDWDPRAGQSVDEVLADLEHRMEQVARSVGQRQDGPGEMQSFKIDCQFVDMAHGTGLSATETWWGNEEPTARATGWGNASVSWGSPSHLGRPDAALGALVRGAIDDRQITNNKDKVITDAMLGVIARQAVELESWHRQAGEIIEAVRKLNSDAHAQKMAERSEERHELMMDALTPKLLGFCGLLAATGSRWLGHAMGEKGPSDDPREREADEVLYGIVEHLQSSGFAPDEASLNTFLDTIKVPKDLRRRLMRRIETYSIQGERVKLEQDGKRAMHGPLPDELLAKLRDLGKKAIEDKGETKATADEPKKE